MKRALVGFLALGLGLGLAQQAPIKIGVVVSATGPAASLGIPERNTLALIEERLSKLKIGGRAIQFVILDDASNPTNAVKNTQKLIQEDKVVAIIGTTTTPASLAMIDVVAEAGVPTISLAASRAIIAPVDEKKKWVFKTPQTEEQMARAVVADMKAQGIKTVAYIGFNDAYGEGWAQFFEAAAKAEGIQVVANERFQREDTSVTGTVLKVIARNPDGVLIGASGTPAALPQKALKERGYKGQIWQTHGVANPDFLRVGGDDVVGTRLPAGPILVFDQLPANFPTKKVATQYVQAYETKYGIGSYSTFGAHAYDAWLILEAALKRAQGKESPDNLAAFRKVLRDEIEATKGVVATHGTFSFSPTDHLGLQFTETAVMVRIIKDANGKLDWKLERTFR